MPDTPNHIALFLPSLEGGGAERVMVDLAAGFAELGYKIDLVLVEAHGVYLSQVPSNVKVIDLHARNAYACIPGLLSYLYRERPDVVLSTLPLTDLVVLLVRRLAFVPRRIVLSCTTTVSILPRSAVKKALERLLLAWIYPWADEIVAVSHGVALDLSYYAGISLSRINVIYNPVITPDIPEKAKEPIKHLWFDQADRGDAPIPVVLGMGRLNQEKSFSTLIRAFAIVREKMPCRLMILGEGKERQPLEALANKLGISSELFMPGFVKNPFAYLSKASVFVLSSTWEGLPSALIQALACNCPVVSTDCPSGPLEILKGGEYGHLVPVGDVQAMADAIMKVLADDLRKPPAEWLRQFELKTVIHQYLNIMGMPCTG